MSQTSQCLQPVQQVVWRCVVVIDFVCDVTFVSSECRSHEDKCRILKSPEGSGVARKERYPMKWKVAKSLAVLLAASAFLGLGFGAVRYASGEIKAESGIDTDSPVSTATPTSVANVAPHSRLPSSFPRWLHSIAALPNSLSKSPKNPWSLPRLRRDRQLAILH